MALHPLIWLMQGTCTWFDVKEGEERNKGFKSQTEKTDCGAIFPFPLVQIDPNSGDSFLLVYTRYLHRWKQWDGDAGPKQADLIRGVLTTSYLAILHTNSAALWIRSFPRYSNTIPTFTCILANCSSHTSTGYQTSKSTCQTESAQPGSLQPYPSDSFNSFECCVHCKCQFLSPIPQTEIATPEFRFPMATKLPSYLDPAWKGSTCCSRVSPTQKSCSSVKFSLEPLQILSTGAASIFLKYWCSTTSSKLGQLLPLLEFGLHRHYYSRCYQVSKYSSYPKETVNWIWDDPT